MDEVTTDGPGVQTQAERDDLQLAIYVQLSRILDVLYFVNKDRAGVEELMQQHQQGKIYGPEPRLAE